MKKRNYVLLCAALIFSATTPKENTIFDDARAGNAQAIRERIHNGEDCAKKDENGNTVLHIASENGDTESVDILTTKPTYPDWDSRWLWSCFGYTPVLPDPNATNNNGDTPLHLAMEQEHVETSEKLLEKGADPKITNKQDLSPVFNAIHENKRKIVPFLVKHKLINQRNNGNNALHFAIKYNLLDMVGDLAKSTDLALQENNQGKTPTMVAAEQKDITSLKILHINGVNLNTRGQYGRQPIHSAALAGNYEGAKYLLENGVCVDSNDNNDNTGLLLATSTGDIKVVDLFLAYKADAKKRNKKGEDILCIAVNNNRRNLIERLKQHPDVKIDGRDDAGRTAFMNATIAGNHSMMRMLYEVGANIHILDNKGENAIHKVAQSGDTNGLALLIPYHSSDHLDKKNHQGNSPIFVAIENGNCNIVTQLLYAGVSLNDTNNNGETVFHKIAQCKNAKALPTLLSTIMNNPLSKPHIATQAHNGLSAMHYASANDNVAGMQELAKYHALYTDLTVHNDTLAHTAAECGALNSLQHLKSVIPMMLQQRNKNNQTPFITSAAKGKLDALKLLFCENDIITRDISAAISIARANKHAHIVSFLEQAETERLNFCANIAAFPQKIADVEKEIATLHQKLIEKDLSYGLYYLGHKIASPKQYSTNDLYYKTEPERSQILREYREIHESVLLKKSNLKTEYDNILYKEKLQREENERVAREEAARQAQLAEQKRQADLQDRLRRQEAEEARVAAERAEQNRQAALREEAARLDQYKKEAEAKQKKAELIAEQKALFDGFEAKKAKDDAAAKHAASLEKQQPHVQVNVNPANLLPSAPSVEEKQKIVCAVCEGKPSAKPLPCKKCKKKSADICNSCFKKYDGQCPTCWKEIGQFTKLQAGECCIGTAACTEEKGVTSIPCDNCKNSSDKNCPPCFELCHKKNIELNQPNRCPRCGKDTLNQTLIKGVKAQK